MAADSQIGPGEEPIPAAGGATGGVRRGGRAAWGPGGLLDPRRLLRTIAGLGLFLALWQMAVSLGFLSLPGPVPVLETFARLLVNDDPVFGRTLPEMVGLSLWIVLRAALIGIAAGVVVGTVLGTWRPARVLAEPVLGLLQPIPPLAWLPLAYVIFAGVASPSLYVQIFVVALAVFFPVFSATLQGVEYVPPIYAMVARTFGARRGEILWRVALPAAFPSIVAGVRVGLAVGWMSIIAAEFVGGRTGIGFYVWNAYSIGGRVAEIMAGIIAIGLTGLAMHTILLIVEEWMTPWHRR